MRLQLAMQIPIDTAEDLLSECFEGQLLQGQIESVTLFEAMLGEE